MSADDETEPPAQQKENRVRHAPADRPASSGSDGQDEPGESKSRHRRRPDTRGGSSHERRTADQGKEPTSGRRSQRSEGREERRKEGREEKSDGRRSHHRGHGHDRGRAQRGDVRAAILAVLADEPMHGYQLMRAIAERTEGAWRPSPGAIYPTIAQLEDEGLVSVVAGAGRKQVTLTQAGRDYMEANRDAMADPFTEITSQGGGSHDLRGPVELIETAARAVGKSGTDLQIEQAQQILIRARRDLYLILAAEPTDPADTTGQPA